MYSAKEVHFSLVSTKLRNFQWSWQPYLTGREPQHNLWFNWKLQNAITNGRHSSPLCLSLLFIPHCFTREWGWGYSSFKGSVLCIPWVSISFFYLYRRMIGLHIALRNVKLFVPKLLLFISVNCIGMVTLFVATAQTIQIFLGVGTIYSGCSSNFENETS